MRTVENEVCSPKMSECIVKMAEDECRTINLFNLKFRNFSELHLGKYLNVQIDKVTWIQFLSSFTQHVVILFVYIHELK